MLYTCLRASRPEMLFVLLVQDASALHTPYMQVLAALRFYGTGAFQVTVGDHTHIHQTTVGRAVKRVSIALAQKRVPGMQQITPYRAFYEMHGFPSAIGLIDCIHIRIGNPGGEDAGRFLNRKGYHSINTQVICDATPPMTNIVRTTPGFSLNAESRMSLNEDKYQTIC